uniref:Transmembrane protein n=1 Tax=Periophthalmus magnuspinnatus TaxID=409849 RepID=A0A3B4AUP2_9GOBI
MELPFSGFELTFIILAFFIFSLFSLISVCFQPDTPSPGRRKRKRKIRKGGEVCASSVVVKMIATVTYQLVWHTLDSGLFL